jgi:hypothetical protein
MVDQLDPQILVELLFELVAPELALVKPVLPEPGSRSDPSLSFDLVD